MKNLAMIFLHPFQSGINLLRDKTILAVVFTIAFFMSAVTHIALAQFFWSSDPNTNKVICQDPGDQGNPKIVSDEFGGAFICWSDAVLQEGYLQHVSAVGSLLWPHNLPTVYTVDVVGDGQHGVYLLYVVNTNELRVRRADGNGTTRSDMLLTSHLTQSYFNTRTMINDGTGGVIVIWQERPSASNYDIYAQHIDDTGTKLWGESGVVVCPHDGSDKGYMDVASDGAGGAIITWGDKRNYNSICPFGTPCFIDIFAQWINVDGNIHQGFSANGVNVTPYVGDQFAPKVVGKPGGSGAYIFWTDYWNVSKDVYGKEVYANGSISDWITISDDYDHQVLNDVISDGQGGVIVAWQDDFFAPPPKHYISRYPSRSIWKRQVGDTGGPLNMINGLDGSIIVAWQSYGIFAQKINIADGSDMWGTDGIKITSESPSEKYVLASACPGGAIFAWESGGDIFAQNVTYDGNLGVHQYTICAGWNMVSVPFELCNSEKSTLYPTALSEVFTYCSAGYCIEDPLKNGPGYWLKFSGGQNIAMTGKLLDHLTINVKQGWNMIGSISTSISTDAIIENPPGIASYYYGFACGGGYYRAYTIDPGRGYWVKVSQPGTLTLDASFIATKQNVQADPLVNFNKLIIKDAKGNKQELFFGFGGNVDLTRYELPPVPPDGSFYVRYSSGKYVETLGELQKKEIPLQISSVNYPVTINWDKGDGKGSLSMDGKEKILEGSGKIVINKPQSQVILKLSQSQLGLVPTKYSIEQNYPNPFNPTTQIEYAIPTSGHVSIKVFNMLGQIVAVLVDDVQDAGYKSVTFDASDLPSGIYTYRLSAETFTQVKKMVLVK